MADTFNLRALIREVCDTSTMTDPGALAAEVHRRITPEQETAALAQALPILVQHVVSRTRWAAPVQEGGSAAAVVDSFESRSPASGPAPRSNRSRKVASIRETWRRMLRDRIAVGPDTSDWKFLGDCTASDLDYAATIREDHARRNAARADLLRRLCALLDEHGATTVSQLPEAVLAGNLEAAA